MGSIAVIGLGGFGLSLARELAELGHDVLAVDRNPDTLEAAERFAAKVANADAADKEALLAAGVADAEIAVVGLGTEMEASVLATLFLREVGVQRVLAKANSREHAQILKRLGATEIVQPERDAAVQLAQRLADPQIIERVPLLEDYALAELEVPRTFWGHSLRDIRVRSRHGLSVVIIRRPGDDGPPEAVAAQADEMLQPRDRWVVLGSVADINRFRSTYAES